MPAAMTEPNAPPNAALKPRRTWSEVFDPAAALTRLDGDEELLRMLVGVFQQDNRELFQQLLAAVESGDLRTAERAAHSLKGLAANFDAHAAAQAAQTVEQLAHTAQGGGLTAPVRLLRERLDDLCDALSQWEAGQAG